MTNLSLSMLIAAAAALPAAAKPPVVYPDPPFPMTKPPTGLVVEVEPAPNSPPPAWCPGTRFQGVDLVCTKPGAASPATPVSGTAEFDVTLRMATTVIWSGTLHVAAGYYGASMQQNKSESFACLPTPSQSRASQTLNTSFSVRLGGVPDSGRVPVTVEVTRPFQDPQKAGAVCNERGPGTRTVRFETQAEFPVGRAVTIAGDADVSVSITRRLAAP